jgi:hypothetical protein
MREKLKQHGSNVSMATSSRVEDIRADLGHVVGEAMVRVRLVAHAVRRQVRRRK